MIVIPSRLVPQPLRTGKSRPTAGFTLVEMLVAMAITLVMMAALARSFSYVSANVQESRANTELAASLRDMTTRLSDELAQCTVSLQPNLGGEDQLGYFVYYEGPTTDATSSLFRAANDAAGNVVLSDAKYGDFDDYIAFTAVAPGNSWFTGKVPRYLLDMKTAQLTGAAYTPGTNAFDPVVIQSKYAEIIYFAAPEYSTFGTATPASQLVDPAYIDVDGDLDLGSGSAIQNGLPDRMRIHRRVLLIRPDLNLADGMLPIQNNGTVDFMLPDQWPTATSTGANPTVIDRTDAGQANLLSLGWLYGMAGIHQQCDLSVRRVIDTTGNPAQRVAANSLADLAKPHNRFAHVRVPNQVLIGGGGNLPTSMPLLALGSAPTILNTNTSAASVQIAPPDIPNTGPVVTPVSLCGFLRPEFILGYDYVHLDSSADVWGRERIGEDLLTNNALGFDVQIFDPEASFFRASNGVLVGPSDPGYREVVIQEIDPVSPAAGNPIDNLINRERGGFVDLCYPVLAGGSLRGWQPRRVDRRSNADDAGFNPILDPANAPTVNFLSTPFSGVLGFTSTAAATNARAVYQPFLAGSGKLVTNGTTIRLFQPTFDTFTSSYERDGFGQAPTNTTSDGTLWWPTSVTTVPIDPGADGLDNDQMFGADDFGEREATPPFESRPEAIRVTIRIENPAVRLIRQASVEYRDRN